MAAGPGVHPSMYTKGPSARHPLQLQQSSFHKPKPDPPTPSHCLINPSQLTLPLSTNKGEPTMWPEVRGLLQPATKNRPEREGNPGPDQLLLQISMKNTDNSFLRQTILPIIIGCFFFYFHYRLNKRDRYQKE